jgi:hypothetical protein
MVTNKDESNLQTVKMLAGFCLHFGFLFDCFIIDRPVSLEFISVAWYSFFFFYDKSASTGLPSAETITL